MTSPHWSLVPIKCFHMDSHLDGVLRFDQLDQFQQENVLQDGLAKDVLNPQWCSTWGHLHWFQLPPLKRLDSTSMALKSPVHQEIQYMTGGGTRPPQNSTTSLTRSSQTCLITSTRMEWAKPSNDFQKCFEFGWASTSQNSAESTGNFLAGTTTWRTSAQHVADIMKTLNTSLDASTLGILPATQNQSTI